MIPQVLETGIGIRSETFSGKRNNSIPYELFYEYFEDASLAFVRGGVLRRQPQTEFDFGGKPNLVSAKAE